jgi:hypothetical protein
MMARMHDFDFLIGSWNVANRRLTRLFVGSTEWEEFPGHSTVRPLFDGAANIDEITFPTLGNQGATMRLFAPQRREWSIYWASSRTGTLFPPVVGTFNNGRGDFYGDDTHEGQPIKAHFIWSHITPTSAHWEQEFSHDGGKTWETNWTMELSRA